jgi:UDP-N-acetylglucosamine 2-epimerase
MSDSGPGIGELQQFGFFVSVILADDTRHEVFHAPDNTRWGVYRHELGQEITSHQSRDALGPDLVSTLGHLNLR